MSATFKNMMSGRRSLYRVGSRERRSPDRMYFLQDVVSRPLLILNILLALIYFCLLAFFFQRGNVYLFTLLIVGEVYHVWQILGYIHTIWSPAKPSEFDTAYKPPVDVFITVC